MKLLTRICGTIIAFATCVLAVSAAPAAVDARKYLPIEPLDNTVRVYEIRDGGKITKYYQEYAVTKEGGKTILRFRGYGQDFELVDEYRQEVTADGLAWTDYATWSKGKSGSVERFPGSASGLILPWKLDSSKPYEKKFSITWWYDSTWGNIINEITQTLTFKGIATTVIDGKSYECAVIVGDQVTDQRDEKGRAFPSNKASYEFYYARDFGYAMSKPLSGSTATTVCTRSMTVAEFEALKSGN
ncbi:MAG: hypothetical protein ABSG21_14705 [Spirochaetia bacterium]|jgi:hypothetical protein